MANDKTERTDNRDDAEAALSDGAEGASGSTRLTTPADAGRQPRLPFAVVGIGASAGGLEAFTEFLRACPADAGMAYVLIQHLPPDRESMLVEILAKHTEMPVAEVEDGMEVEPNHVYVIRPGHTLTLRKGRLRNGPDLAQRGHGRPVDDFFRSLAEEQQQRAVAVVFSGMGSNGAAGAQAVRAVGGLVIAQEPESARFPTMPRSLIDAHLPDFILRPAEVPEALVRYIGHPYATGEATAQAPREEQTLNDVLSVLRTRTRHNFAGYRKPTLLRRVRRRMGLGQYTLMTDYVRALRQTPAEVAALADDLLIHVTGFFRDPRGVGVVANEGDRAAGRRTVRWGGAALLGLRLRHRRGGVHPGDAPGRSRRGPREAVRHQGLRHRHGRAGPDVGPARRVSQRDRERGLPGAAGPVLREGRQLLPGAQGPARDGDLRPAKRASGPAVLPAGSDHLPEPADLPGAGDPAAGSGPLALRPARGGAR